MTRLVRTEVGGVRLADSGRALVTPREELAVASPHRYARGAGQIPTEDRSVSVAVRAIRGAIQIDHDGRDEILAGTTELVREVLRRNDVAGADLISIMFTVTPDLTAEFPA